MYLKTKSIDILFIVQCFVLKIPFLHASKTSWSLLQTTKLVSIGCNYYQNTMFSLFMIWNSLLKTLYGTFFKYWVTYHYDLHCYVVCLVEVDQFFFCQSCQIFKTSEFLKHESSITGWVSTQIWGSDPHVYTG